MVRIAIPSDSGDGLDSYLAEHFGRAPYYVLVDIEDGRIADVKVEKNPAISHIPGVVPRYLKDRGVDVVIAMGMGPRAMDLFDRFGIKVVTGAQGKVRDIVEAYLSGRLVSRPYQPKFRFHEF